MRHAKWLMMSLTLLLLLQVPAISQNSGNGKYASGAPSPSRGWPVPPGHYGLLASYADSFLASGPYSVGFAAIDTTQELSPYFILDVRSPSGPTGFAAKHLVGAVNIPYAQVTQNLDVLPLDKPILVVCQSGLMSGQVGAILGMLGYEVRMLSGGMGSSSVVCGGVVVGTSCP